MRGRLWLLAPLAALIAGGGVVGALLAGRTPAPEPSAPGTFSFAVLGDAPYGDSEQRQYAGTLADIDAHPLHAVIHVGDILAGPCTDQRFARSLDWFNGLGHPVIYTPGDNEWADCWGETKHGFAPAERLQRLRQMFFANPARSLGKRPLPLVSQAASGEFAEFVENARWTHQGVLFTTVHLVGSRNGLLPFPGRTAADVQEVKRRTEAAAAWVREAFTQARALQASAVVVAFHAFPFFERPVHDSHRQPFEPFLGALEEEVESFGRPVLAVHGDYHRHVIDHPLVSRRSGLRLQNFTRMQVPGSPNVGWVRVVVTAGSPAPFAFQARVVPYWKIW